MSVIERYHWHVSDEVEFKKLHREFFDQYLKKAGAKEMLMNQESSGSWMNFQVDVIFEDWSGKNAWNDFFNTCLLYTSPSPRDATLSRMPSSA